MDNATNTPTGIRITAILFILISVIEIASMLIESVSNGSLLPPDQPYAAALVLFVELAGLAAGIGLMRMKNWARRLVLIYSIATVLLTFSATSILIMAVKSGKYTYTLSGPDAVETACYLALAVWSIYYLRRPAVKGLFVPKHEDKNDKPEAASSV